MQSNWVSNSLLIVLEKMAKSSNMVAISVSMLLFFPTALSHSPLMGISRQFKVRLYKDFYPIVFEVI